MEMRKSLFPKNSLIQPVLMGGLLLAGGFIGLYFSYQANREALFNLQREKAQAAAGRIEQRLSGIAHQTGLTVSPPPGADASVRGSQEISLFLLEDIKDIAARSSEKAYVVDARGTLIVHSDTMPQRGKNELSTLPQVQAALTALPGKHGQAMDGVDLQGRPVVAAYGLIEPMGWRVFVEQPWDDAFAPWQAWAWRNGLLLAALLPLALLSGAALARRTAAPIRTLLEGAIRIGEGTSDRGIEIHTGDELELLAEHYNRMARRLHDSCMEMERIPGLMRAQRSAERERKRLIDMIEALPLAVFQFRETANGGRKFTFVSENVRHVLGVSAGEIIRDRGARWRHVLPEDRDVIQPELKHAIAERWPIEFHHRIRLGDRVRWVHAYAAAPQMIDGDWVWSGLWMDETVVRARQDDLQEAKERAEAAMRNQSIILADMWHEILSPMNAILGLSHLTLKTDLTPQQLEYVNKIHRAGASLLEIVNDLLDLARIEAGKLVIETTRFKLRNIMENVIAAAAQEANGKGLELGFEISPILPRTLIGNPVRLEQILCNLVGNAIKYTERGKVEVQVESIYSTDSQIMLRFSVHDTGACMTAAQREHLFNPSARPEQAGVRKYGGSGLELIICKRLIEMMGGAIHLEGREGIGNSFSFTVRLGLEHGQDRRRPRSKIERLDAPQETDNAVDRQASD